MAQKVRTRRKVSGLKLCGRSRITNGRVLLPSVDGRSLWARRLRDLINLHQSDLGGAGSVSTAEQSIIRRAACLTVELELMEVKFASNGGADNDGLHAYGQTANTLRRLLQAIGLERRAKNVTPSVDQYLHSQGYRRGEATG